METKALISCAITPQLICVFVFAYAKVKFSHGAAQLMCHKIPVHIAKTNKGVSSLLSLLVIECHGSVIPTISIYTFKKLVSIVVQASVDLTWSETQETHRF